MTTSVIPEVRGFLEGNGIDFFEDGEVLYVPMPSAFGNLVIYTLTDDSIIGLAGEEWHTYGSMLLSFYKSADTEADAICKYVKDIFDGKCLSVEIRRDGKVRKRYFEDVETESEIWGELDEGDRAFVHNTGRYYDYADKPMVEAARRFAIVEWTMLGRGHAPADGAGNGNTVVIDIEDFKQDRKIFGIKTLRDITGLGIADAKQFIEHLPQSRRLTFTGGQDALLDDLRHAGLSASIEDL